MNRKGRVPVDRWVAVGSMWGTVGVVGWLMGLTYGEKKRNRHVRATNRGGILLTTADKTV